MSSTFHILSQKSTWGSLLKLLLVYYRVIAKLLRIGTHKQELYLPAYVIHLPLRGGVVDGAFLLVLDEQRSPIEPLLPRNTRGMPRVTERGTMPVIPSKSNRKVEIGHD